jgi:hypothetical protein
LTPLSTESIRQRRNEVKLNVMFTIAAAYGILLGLFLWLAPGAAFALGGMLTETMPSSLSMLVRFTGVEELGLGIIAWLVRNTDASKARDAVALGFTVYFALHALTSLYGAFTDTSTSGHWFMAILQGLIAVGFFMAGRASMSAQTS